MLSEALCGSSRLTVSRLRPNAGRVTQVTTVPDCAQRVAARRRRKNRASTEASLDETDLHNDSAGDEMKDEGTVAAISLLMILAVSLLVFPGGAVSPDMAANQPEASALASCLKNRGVVFYGAFWCPYCQKQKALFGDAASLLPYVECSNPDGRGQTPVCIQQGIRKYPTWVFPDGTRVIAKLSPQELAEKSGCAAPKE